MKFDKLMLLIAVAMLVVVGCQKPNPEERAAANAAKTAPKTEVKTEAAKPAAPAETTKPAPATPAEKPAAPEAKPAAPAKPAMEPLKIKLPKFTEVGTLHPPKKDEPNMEEAKAKDWVRKPFLAPAGTVNLALNKEVTASEDPMIGDLAQIVDGQAESNDDCTLDLGADPTWVTIDLGKKCEIFAILMWHRHDNRWVVRDVIVEVADDKDFITNKKILFNNDADGSLGKGHPKGTDKQYLENYQGKLVDAKGVKARYVRFWSNGDHYNGTNYWIEAQVFGRELK